MRKKDYLALGMLGFFLIIFSIFTTKIGFHDSFEYINITKNFIGIENINLFSGHSLLYPLVISLFLKIWSSFVMLKFVNVFWIFLIGSVLLVWLKNKKAFVLFAFSPLTWYIAIQTTPVLPASFFFLLAFVFFYKKNINKNFLYSGFCLGLSCAFYTPILIVAFVFILVYFWETGFKDFIRYLVAMLVGFLPRIIQDYYLFKMPLYSSLRYVGSNFIVFSGLNPLAKNVNFLSNLWILSVFVITAPFLFKIYKINFKEYKKPIIFLGLISLIIILRAQEIKYFLIISPILFILLSKVLNKKDFKWNCIISVILIILLTFNFFVSQYEIRIQNDLVEINRDFDVDYIIAGPSEATMLAAFWWENHPKYVWWEDYEASLENKTTIRDYRFKVTPILKLKSNLEIIVNFNRAEDITYENYILVLRKEAEKAEGFELIKCYDELCTYEKG